MRKYSRIEIEIAGQSVAPKIILQAMYSNREKLLRKDYRNANLPKEKNDYGKQNYLNFKNIYLIIGRISLYVDRFNKCRTESECWICHCDYIVA